MTTKALRKQHKRAHIKAAIEVQDRWIAEAFGVAVEDRRDRDRLFTRARAIKGNHGVA